MGRKMFLFLSLTVLIIGLVAPTLALEKVKLGSSVKMHPPYYLPVLAAEEKGLWRDNGLEVEWVPFAGGTPFARAIAAGSINIGTSTISTPMTGAERGLPVVMVAELGASEPFLIWVKADSPYRNVRDLKGAKIGVTVLGGTVHIYSRIIVAAHGVEKEVRFVGAGGISQQMAGLKAGGFEATLLPLASIVDLKLAGQVRDISSTVDYLPKPWLERAILIRKDFGKSKPDLVRKVIKATLQSHDFLQKNPRWAIDKIKSFGGLSEEAAKLIYDDLNLSTTGRLERKAVENVRRVFMEYGILTEKAPAVDDLFTNEYVS